MHITQTDRAILRELAKHQMDLAYSKENKMVQNEWYRHHRFEKGRPMVHIEIGTFEHEIIPKRLRCETPFGRELETTLYRQFINHEIFNDDRVVPDYFPVYWQTHFTLFDLKIHVTHASNNDGLDLGHQFDHILTDLKAMIPNLLSSTFGVDRNATNPYKAAVEDILGDILPVRLVMNSLTSCPTQDLVHLMGMESLFLAMYDVPDLFKKMMEQVSHDYITYFRWLESEGLLLPTVGAELLGNGSFCFNETLPNTQVVTSTRDVWGFMDSQETVGVSPDMFNEFIFPCYQTIAKEFGLMSYGCCEPVHSLWESSLSHLDNLKKISISPWCNETYMGEQLRDRSIIYFRKPSPNYLGVGTRFDEEGFRAHIRATVKAASGCQLEFAQRDVYTINHDEDKVRRAVQIIREECSL